MLKLQASKLYLKKVATTMQSSDGIFNIRKQLNTNIPLMCMYFIVSLF